MNWTGVFIFAGVVAAFILLKRAGQISAKSALDHLKNGALVIDVRSPDEFNSGHLPQAVNIPLDEIETGLARLTPGKNRVLLLHCLSGTRSAFAKSKLKRLGYTNVFNLGSFGRARKIVNSV
ncbi:MAG TPA: rhodanese-like domain-containing protein [Verrucomicrobiae bacterium]|nr:rhodanese-like domain-containing protein [Verrucomicrobiae bacterium]